MMWLVVSEGAKSILSVAACWHSPYCAILPAILPDKQSRLSRSAIDGGGGAGRGRGERAQEEKHIYMSGERIFPATAVSSPSQRRKVSRAPSRRTLSLSPSLHFSPAFIPAAPQHSLTIVIVTNQYGLSADAPHPPPPPVLLLSFFKTVIQQIVRLKCLPGASF